MMSVMIIAPHAKLAAVAERVARNHSDVGVALGLLEESLAIGRRAEAEGADVLISRGGTAQMLAEQITGLPVVEIPVSPYDLFNAIHRARSYGRYITVIGFERVIQGVEQLAPILDVDISVHRIESAADAAVSFQRALARGQRIDVLLGGVVAENLAKAHGIPTVLLETSELAIENSIREARRLIEIRNQERQKAEQVKAILHYINQGVLAVDRHGVVTTFNPAAAKITGIRQSDILGRRIDHVLPGSRIPRVMEENRSELGQLEKIGGGMTLANRVPIIVKGETVGAVETFEDVGIIQQYEQKIRLNLLRKGHVTRYAIGDIVGASPALAKAKELARKYAAVDSTVLIVGESGTGKEMFAQSIHNLSRRRRGPFVAVNCAAIPESLLESELFGYEEGAFTGARRKGKSGLFTVAHKGTVFLDEITEMPPSLQARLLRVLQEKEVLPLGSEKVVPVDIRIIAATNTDLAEEVRAHRFRKDLYFRLSILTLRIPSLPERGRDVRRLADHFVAIYARRLNKKLSLDPEAYGVLEGYGWPGNIRELENVIERLCVTCDGRIRRGEVAAVIGELRGALAFEAERLEDVSREHVFRVLARCGGNRSLAARRLGISRSSLWRLLKTARPGP